MPTKALAVLLLAALAAGTLHTMWGSLPGSPPPDREPPPELPSPGPENAVASPPPAPPPDEPVVSGRVLWPDGQPFDGGEIVLRRAGVEERERGYPRVAPSNGRFRFEAEREKPLELVVLTWVHEHRSHGIESEVLGRWPVAAGDRDLELTLPGGPERPLLDLRVEDPAGRPVRKGTVIVGLVGGFDLDGRELRLKDGRARCLLRAPARRVVLTVYNANDADGKPLGRFADGPFAVTAEPVRIRLPAGRTIRGRVVGPDGERVSGVGLQVYHPPPLFGFCDGFELSDCVCGWLRTDDEGDFTIPHVGPGPVRLAIRVPHPGLQQEGDLPWLPPEDRPVGAGEDDLRILLRAGAAPEVRVFDSEDDPVKDEITVRGEAEAEPPAPEERPARDGVLHLRFDPKLTRGGRCASAEIVPEDGGPARELGLSLPEDTIEGLDPAKSYTLRAIGIGPGLVVEARGLRPGPGLVELTPRPGAGITGRIDLPPGVTDASVRARRGALSPRGRDIALIYADGRFEIFGLLPGRWEVGFRVGVGDRRYRATISLSTDGPPTRVALEPLD